ncbi:MAG TPA: pectinesterase family protein, partial [Acidobacteriaceae bacterium]|nr:pectinesterase family protein [Acidobacteriaceae bacterium]
MASRKFAVLVAGIAFALSNGAYAADVHVRVDPSARAASPGQENRSVFPTIQNALDHHPFATDGGRVFIEIAPGVYHERVIVTQNHSNITLIGLGKTPADTVITNSLNAKTAGGTFFTETVELNGTGFEADNLTFENTAGNTGQAVAVANRSDRSVFKHCRILGHQDTLFADYGRQYYVDSYIEGGVDYIFGNAAAVFDRDELHSNGPGFVTAQ